MISLPEPIQFVWDTGNQNKNWKKHGVTAKEAEEVFINEPLLFLDDTKHSTDEKRHHVLGHTNIQRRLFIAVTVRDDFIRIISARDMSKKERRVYEKAEKIEEAARI